MYQLTAGCVIDMREYVYRGIESIKVALSMVIETVYLSTSSAIDHLAVDANESILASWAGFLGFISYAVLLYASSLVTADRIPSGALAGDFPTGIRVTNPFVVFPMLVAVLVLVWLALNKSTSDGIGAEKSIVNRLATTVICFVLTPIVLTQLEYGLAYSGPGIRIYGPLILKYTWTFVGLTMVQAVVLALVSEIYRWPIIPKPLEEIGKSEKSARLRMWWRTVQLLFSLGVGFGIGIVVPAFLATRLGPGNIFLLIGPMVIGAGLISAYAIAKHHYLDVNSYIKDDVFE